MTYFTFAVDAAPGMLDGIKEALAMTMEQFGDDVRLVSAKEVQPEQLNFLGGVRLGDV